MENIIGWVIFIAVVAFVAGKVTEKLSRVTLPYMRKGFWVSVWAALAGAVAAGTDLIQQALSALGGGG